MMVLQLFFSPAEIKQFFENNGFEVIQGTFGKWGQAYHNRDEWNEYTADAVCIDGRYIEATKLFEKVAEIRLKQLIAPVSGDVKNTIETAFHQLLKLI
jgi:hypothetical protein